MDNDKKQNALTFYILGFTFFIIGLGNIVFLPMGVVFFIIGTTYWPVNRIGELFENKKEEPPAETPPADNKDTTKK